MSDELPTREWLLRRVAELELQLQSAGELALKDDLTGLLNRRGFLFQAEVRIELARRAKEEVSLGLADMDGLKRINDTLGHAAGDAAIIRMAATLKKACRTSDLMARVGGDEFLFLAVGRGAERAIKMRIALEVGAVNDLGGELPPLAISLAFHPLKSASLAETVALADAEMYSRKRRKRIEAAVGLAAP